MSRIKLLKDKNIRKRFLKNLIIRIVGTFIVLYLINGIDKSNWITLTADIAADLTIAVTLSLILGYYMDLKSISKPTTETKKV